jgi:hypothetical protein
MQGIPYQDPHGDTFAVSLAAAGTELGALAGGWGLGKYSGHMIGKAHAAVGETAAKLEPKFKNLGILDTGRASATSSITRGPQNRTVAQGRSWALQHAYKDSVHKATFSKARGLRALGTKYMAASAALGYMSLAAAGYQMGQGVFNAVGDYSRSRRLREVEINEPTTNIGMGGMSTNGAFTQRQRAMQVIHNSQLSSRAAFGSEAAHMHY